MATYVYKAEMQWIYKGNKYVNIPQINIKSIVIRSDYKNTNMPVIFVTLALDKSLIDKITLGVNDCLMHISIYKINEEDEFGLEEEYLKLQCMYFIDNTTNDHSNVDYASIVGDVDKSSSSEYANNTMGSVSKQTLRKIDIALMSVETVNEAKRVFNGTYTGSLQSVVQSNIDDIGLVIEQFDSNKEFDQLVIPPLPSLSKILMYLNNIRVFYNTPYRFFLDFDTAYILSSSGKGCPKKGDKYNAINFTVYQSDTREGLSQGLTLNKKQKVYEIPIAFADIGFRQNTVTDKMYTSYTGVTSDGGTNQGLEIINNKASKTNTRTVRVSHDNADMIKNLSAAQHLSMNTLTVSKERMDTSIFTINKQYHVKSVNISDDIDGTYIITNKTEMFVNAGTNLNSSVMLSFSKV